MFFIIFVLLCSKYFPINSLRCMSHSDSGFLWSLATMTPCTFDVEFGKSIPKNDELSTSASKCAMRDADTDIKIGKADGSCYGEVSIDYATKKITVVLKHVSFLKSTQSPYDDMFGFLNGIKSVIQYKITGDLKTGQVQMITRVQCKTSDNCALEKLRGLLPDLIITDSREKLFKQLMDLLNTPDANPGTLTCVDQDNQDTECTDQDARCLFHLSKEGSTKNCAIDGSFQSAVKYRFNLVEEIEEGGSENTAQAMKCEYICNNDRCNSEDIFEKVDNLLYAYALVPKSIPQESRPAPVNQNPTPSAKKNGACFILSFYLQSIIILSSLFVQILSI